MKQDSAHHTTRPVSHLLPYCYPFKLCVLSLWLARGVWNKSVSSLRRWETLSLNSCTKIGIVKAMLQLPYTTRTRQNALYKSGRNHHKYANIIIIIIIIILLTLQPRVGLGLFNNSIPFLSVLYLRPPTNNFHPL